MKNILVIGVLVVIIAVGAFIFLNKTNMTTAPSTTTPAPGSTSNAVEPNNIIISNFSFSPETLNVKVGTTVTWTNNDSVTHNIKSSSFNSPNLSTGDTFKFTFNTPGTFNYNCGIHPSMTGTIIVH